MEDPWKSATANPNMRLHDGFAFVSGWGTSSGDELHRKYSEILILDDLRSFLQQRYPDFTPDELERIVFNLSNTGGDTDYLSLRATASLCINGFIFRATIFPCRMSMLITST